MELTNKEKGLIFWASFAALGAAGLGFALRVLSIVHWGPEYGITGQDAGAIFGLSLWPIAVMMILFSLIVDKVGYRPSMFLACILQIASVILTVMAKDVSGLKWGCFLGGLGHGIIEACINPLCATMYRDQKSKMLNILHASWPAGIVVGGIGYILCITDPTGTTPWNASFWFMMVPILGYGLVFAMIKHYPQDERIEANISNKEMFKEFGGLGAFLAITFVAYELINQMLGLEWIKSEYLSGHLLQFSAILGAIGGIAVGVIVGSKGKWLFFILCLIMIPLAAAELGTDAWIAALMRPQMGDNASWAIVLSAGIMMTLRFFAGVPLKVMSPPALLFVSSLFSMLGLYLLSGATGSLVFLSFVIYAIGQTFYWPTVLGFVAERFPKGGAMTLNTVSAMGLLTIGIFGAPFMGAVNTSYETSAIQQFAEAQNVPSLNEYVGDGNFFGVKYNTIVPSDVYADEALNEEQVTALTNDVSVAGRKTLKVAALLPATMAISFLLIILYFKSQGGYRAVHMEEDNDASAAA